MGEPPPKKNALKMNKNEFKACFRKGEGHLCLKNEKKIARQSPTEIDQICKKCENHYSTGSRKNPWMFICKENTPIYLRKCQITPKI